MRDVRLFQNSISFRQFLNSVRYALSSNYSERAAIITFVLFFTVACLHYRGESEGRSEFIMWTSPSDATFNFLSSVLVNCVVYQTKKLNTGKRKEGIFAAQ